MPISVGRTCTVGGRRRGDVLVRRVVAAAVVALGLAGGLAAGELPAGERYRAVATRRLGPVLGYGEPMLRSQAPPQIAADAAGGDILWGADIGIPVTLQVTGEDGYHYMVDLFRTTVVPVTPPIARRASGRTLPAGTAVQGAGAGRAAPRDRRAARGGVIR